MNEALTAELFVNGIIFKAETTMRRWGDKLFTSSKVFENPDHPEVSPSRAQDYRVDLDECKVYNNS